MQFNVIPGIISMFHVFNTSLKQTFLTFALAVFFGLPSLGLTLPAGDDVANYPGRRGSFSL